MLKDEDLGLGAEFPGIRHASGLGIRWKFGQ